MSENTQGTEGNNQSEWRKRECGALWKREGRSQNFLSGYVKVGEFGVEKEVKLVVFTNKYKKENERAPDFVVYESSDVNSEANSQNGAGSSSRSQPAEEIPDLLE